jgi:hypothetical protein
VGIQPRDIEEKQIDFSGKMWARLDSIGFECQLGVTQSGFKTLSKSFIKVSLQGDDESAIWKTSQTRILWKKRANF